MPISEMTCEAVYGWAGGILDGEGSINASLNNSNSNDNRININVTVTNTDPRIPVALKEIFGIGNFHIEDRRSQINRVIRARQPLYYWRLSSVPTIMQVLTQIRPYLVIKREEADLMLQLCSQMDGSRGEKGRSIKLSLVNKMKDIKGRRDEIARESINKGGLV
jgi:hypothetical protein